MRTRRAALGRFLVVGFGTAAASALAITGIVQATGWDPVVAAAIVAIAGNAVGFVANRQWSFLATHAHPVPQFVRYLTVSVAATAASVGVFALLVDISGMHYVLASVCVSAIFALANFVAHFHWSLAPRERVDTST